MASGLKSVFKHIISARKFFFDAERTETNTIKRLVPTLCLICFRMLSKGKLNGNFRFTAHSTSESNIYIHTLITYINSLSRKHKKTTKDYTSNKK